MKLEEYLDSLGEESVLIDKEDLYGKYKEDDIKYCLIKNNRLIITRVFVKNEKKIEEETIYLGKDDSKFFAYFNAERVVGKGILEEEIESFFEQFELDKKKVLENLKRLKIIDKNNIIISEIPYSKGGNTYITEISSRIKTNMELEYIEKQLKITSKKLEEMKKKSKKIEKKQEAAEKSVVGIMGIFMSLFSVISLNLNIFGNIFNEELNISEKMGVMLILNGSLLIVLLTLLYMLKKFIYMEEEKISLVIAVIIIILGLIA